MLDFLGDEISAIEKVARIPRVRRKKIKVEVGPMFDEMPNWDDVTWAQHENELKLLTYAQRKKHAARCEAKIELAKILIACCERSSRAALYEIYADGR